MFRSILFGFTFAASVFGEETGHPFMAGAGQNAFALPLADITRENRRAHVIGNSFFNQNWVAAPASTTARDGLGPLFHARSCSGCHLRDGRSAPEENGTPLPGLLFRLGKEGASHHHPSLGHQLAPLALPGHETEGRVHIRYEDVPGEYPDGTPFSLRKPIYEFEPTSPDQELAAGVVLAPRIAPPVFGLGLLEAIPEETILTLADPDDEDRNGISGRPAWITIKEKERVLGRFGWKGNQPDLLAQTAAAFLDDMGITSPIHPSGDGDPDMTREPDADERVLDRVVVYLQTLAPPPPRNTDDSRFARGEALFHQVDCAECHVPVLSTRPEVPGFPELSGKRVVAYTDLLLHDMGAGLSDQRADGEAEPSEWRTSPLWGIGLTEAVNGHTFFLHDGRARNLEEAILWHGGEAEGSRERFTMLEEVDRETLLRFLESL